MIITIVAGARPNFMKIAPIIKALSKAQRTDETIRYRLVHTGQHFDNKMSHDFFDQLEIPIPDINLGCGGGTQAEQTAAIMVMFEKDLQQFRPDIVLVVGDVTSTMACTISARKLNIDTAHVEAGLRSGDWTMPEEINRVVTDSISNLFFTTTESARNNLLANSIPGESVHFVGNTMIDTLFQNKHRIQKPAFLNEYKVKEQGYFLCTLHRPSNVDDRTKLQIILDAIADSTSDFRVIFPAHPRTAPVLKSVTYDKNKFLITEPLGYLEFMYLVKHAKGIITDSGGITEEATALNVPCITLRNTTERPETVTMGTNELVGDDYFKLTGYLNKIIANQWKKGEIPPLWDGNTSERIIHILLEIYAKKKVQAIAC